ncbi:alpha-amylase family glycosyl hydrolase [uncultured Hymenobacter sp.]|uniref:alpha-amylase family glycosyl hydrolase n=1 Tax=uncultured Hymenobacter sp. TaxID=170016 RepID=UPI0035CBE464
MKTSVLRILSAAAPPPQPVPTGPAARFGKLRLASLLLLIFSLPRPAQAQNDVMLQGFYWDVPVDVAAKNGTWWDNLRGKAVGMKNAGFTALWVPPPSKGNVGIYDMGYGPFDHYDLGNYNQKGTTETRFGSRTELNNLITTLHQNNLQVYADIVLNHMYTGDEQSEPNPALKAYVFNEAKVGGVQHQSYPTSEIKWVLPAQTAGDYYIQIKGYNLPSATTAERSYELVITYGTPVNGSYWWENEPNNGGGQSNPYPGSGIPMRGRSDSGTDLDEYKVTLTSTQDIVIRLVPKREVSGQWLDAAATNGFYPVAVWKNGTQLNSGLQARTNTKITLPAKTGAGEATLAWDYRDFHPVDANDFLSFEVGDGVLPNVKWFGNDVNTYSAAVQTKFNNWGAWLVNTVGFDGFRLDFVRGYQEGFLASWINNLPKLNNAQRFIVGEYWCSPAGSVPNIKSWVNNMAGLGTATAAFDFPLKFSLNSLCNGDQNFDMTALNHAGMVRNNGGNALPSSAVVTFLENHDTGKEHDNWVTKDFKLGYAYLLTHEGRPCVFYPHYYGVQQTDFQNNSLTVTPPAALRDDLNKLMFARRTYLGGSLSVLSQTGNPYPAADTRNVYVARRQGGNGKNGAIVVLNNHNTGTKGLWVDSSPAGFQNWTGLTLVNAFDPSQTAVVQSDGRVNLSAPARGYTIWVRQSEYVTYSAPTAARGAAQPLSSPKEVTSAGVEGFRVYPNPATNKISVIPGNNLSGPITLRIHNAQAQLVLSKKVWVVAELQEVAIARLPAGHYTVSIESAQGIERQSLFIVH